MAIAFAIGFFEGLAGTAIIGEAGFLSVIYGLEVLMPGLAVAVRGLHDTGRSGWWLLVGIIPLVGAVVLLIFMVVDSEPGHNLYGPQPKRDITLYNCRVPKHIITFSSCNQLL